MAASPAFTHRRHRETRTPGVYSSLNCYRRYVKLCRARQGYVELLIKKGADINKCGLGPFPVFCSPLFAASAALRYGHPDADWLFETIIKSSASANALGYFPGGSQSTAMIELIRCVGESKSKVRRENVFSKIESLLKMGADANQSCLDCFLNTTPTAYTDIIQYRAGLTPGRHSS